MGELVYGSLCTGIAGEGVAWGPLGWRPLWHAEIDPFCRSTLEHHYGEVPNLGDITQIERPPQVDLIVAGTPCQSFSTNAGRAGLDDPRGQLALHFLRIASEVRPRWIVWENVAHALHTHGGRDFGALLGALEDGGYGWAYRVLDLRGFGIPQRRRRVFVVGHLGGGRAPAAVLLGRAEVARAATADGALRGGDPAGDSAAERWCYTVRGDATPKVARDVAPTLCSQQGGEGVVLWTADGPRQLTPVEWERLMGFPDNYTAATHRGRPATDRARRRALGNSFPPPIIRWIGEGIREWEGGDRVGDVVEVPVL